MRKRTFIKPVLLAGSLALGLQVMATPSAQMLSYTCAGCHGTNGASTGDAIPSLAGMSKVYMVETMQEYKTDERNPTIMNRIAKGYSDEEFGLMGDFFAAQPVYIKKDQKFDAGKAKAGAKHHDKYCAKCHEDGGTNAEDESGQLLGNANLYLKYSLVDYIDDSRHMGKKMKKKVDKLLKKDKNAIDKLLNYYSQGEL